jgi:hypothetical protein
MFSTSKLFYKPSAATPATPDPYFPYVSFLSETTTTNGQQNNTFLDSSTNNFTLTRSGTTTQGSVTPYWPNGYWSNYFNGSAADYLSTPNSANLVLGSSNYTIEFWVFATASASPLAMISKGNTSSLGTEFWSVEFSNTTGSFSVYVGAYGSGSAILTGTLTLSAWNHVAVVRNGLVHNLYVNGTSVSNITVGSSYTVASGGNLYIGTGWYTPSTRAISGYISNARIVIGTAVYTSNFTPSTTPLTAITNTQLLTCQSNRFVDNSANAFVLTPNTLPKVQAFQPFSPVASYTTAVYGGSGYFNGSSDYLSVADNVALQLGTGDFTIEGWFYISGATSTAYNLISKGSATTGWSLNTTASARIQFSYTALNLTGATTTLFSNSWYHIAAVRSGSSVGNLKIYINGVQEVASTVAVLDNFNQTDLLYVSASRTATIPLNGYSSNVRVVKGTAVYTAAFTPPTSPVTAITNTSLLINYTNAGVYDAAVQNHLQTLGNAQANTSQYKWSPTSIRIDGTAGTVVNVLDVFNGPFDLNTATSCQAWTIECWVYYTAGGKVITRGGNPGSTSPSYDFSVNAGTGTFTLAGSGGTIASPGYTITYPASTIPTSTWVYWAATRTSAGIVATWVNGIYQGSSGASVPVYNINNYQTSLGATSPFYGVGSILTGYIQDVRITKGIARYSGTGNFTPPATSFPLR